ncbi:MAG: hypothetical protein ABRQ39_01700 [Candidatus Eremiobacterota bacterium]
MKKNKLKYGFSVLEVLISSLILLILMTISSEIMYHSLKISREEQGLAFLRKEALKGMHWFTSDLRITSGASFDYDRDPVANVTMVMSFLTNQENVLASSGTVSKDPNGKLVAVTPVWYGYVVYYLVSDPEKPGTADSTQKYLLKRAKRIRPADSYYSVILSKPYYEKVFNPYMSVAKPLASADVTTLLNKWLILSEGDKNRPDTIARNIYDVNLIEAMPDYVTLTIETRDKNPRGGELKVVYTSRILMRNSNLQSH